ncbi:MAG: hypothetical protein P9M14_02130 [Candidatus Alcyoniella australis]|nr:hypothetical protein [Candidatus Alcyoniella australis]
MNAPGHNSSRSRQALMALVAAAIGLILLLGPGELIARHLNLGAPALSWPSDLNYQKLQQPTLSEYAAPDGSRWLLPGELVNIQPLAVPVRKSERTFRIMLFGGSAAYAGEFEPGGSWPRIVERLLAAAYPERDIQMINLGVVGHSSNEVLPRVAETLAYDPDLLIVYSGNNEALDMTAHFNVRNTSLAALRLRRWLRDHSAIYRLTARLAAKAWTREINLDKQSATHEHRWSEEDWRFVAQRYRRNLERICELADEAQTPLMLSTLVNSEERANRPDRCFFCDSWLGPTTSTDDASGVWHLDWAFELWKLGRSGRALTMLEQAATQIKPDGGEPLVRALIERDLGQVEQAAARAETVAQGLERDERWREHPVLGARYIVALQLCGRRDRLHEVNPEVLKASWLISPEDRLYFLARLSEFTGEDSQLEREVEQILSLPDDVIVTGRRLNPVVQQVAAERGATLLQPDVALRRCNPAGRLGTDALFDYCHFTHSGAHRMAAFFAQAVVDTGLLGPMSEPSDFQALAEQWRLEPWEAGRDSLSLDRFCGVGRNLVNLEHSLPNATARAHAYIKKLDQDDATPEELVWGANVRCRFDRVMPDRAAPRALPLYRLAIEQEPDNPELLQSAAICCLWSGRPDLAAPFVARLFELGDFDGAARRLSYRLEAAPTR